MLSVPSLVATEVYRRLGKSVVYFPWNNRIRLNHGLICIPEEIMRYFIPVTVIIEEKAA